MSDDPREPPRPLIGWFFAPRPPAPGPQVRWLRIPPRGPWRLAFLIAATLGLVTIVAPLLLGLAAARSLSALGSGLGLIVLLAPAIAFLARGWVAGTYVNDAGIKATGILRTTHVAWSDVAGIEVIEARAPFLGLPIWVPARIAQVRCRNGERFATLITSVSPDLWGRPQAYAAATDRIALWWREATGGADTA